MKNISIHSNILSVCVFIIFAHQVSAQTSKDTINIKEISVISKEIKKYQAGSKVEKITGIKLENSQSESLSNLLLKHTTLSVKTVAGSLSTIHFRGSSADHTGINVGPININSLTLGSSNISNVPLFFFDDVVLQFGSSSTVNGSGNIGGSIHLASKNYWVKGVKAQLRLTHGSFGEQMYGAKVYVGNGKLESVTQLYYYYKKNNFKFENNTVKNFETGKIGVDDTQKNANIENKGLMQQLNYKFAAKHYLKLNLWLEKDWHYIQQNQATNFYTPNKKESYEDENIRLWATYDNKKTVIKHHFGLAYVYDNSIFNNTKDPIKTQRFIADLYAQQTIFKHASYKVGAKAMRITPKVYAYKKDLKHEDRIDVFFLCNYLILSKLRLSVNLRQSFISNFTAPFVPAFGISFNLIENNIHKVELYGNIAKSYRVPTFNDRYWQPGGNMNLKPENGMNYELAVNYNYNFDDIRADIKINGFFMDINNWILWRNGGSFWYADNVQKVQSKGIEFIGKISYKVADINIENGLNCAYTNAQRRESLNSNSAINRQLEYVPLIKAGTYASAVYKQFQLSFNANYTHKQYTDESENTLDGYFLLDIAANYKFKLNKTHQFAINTKINNVLNKNYQATIRYAMPGINYQISLVYKLTTLR